MELTKPVRAAAVLSLVGLAGFSARAPEAGAQSTANPVNVALEPVGKAQRIAYTADPGAELAGAVRVQNGTGQAREIALSAVDVGTAPLGGAVYGEWPPRQTGRWLDLGARTVTVPAHGARVVRFRVRVPQSAPAGVHYAAITATDAAQLRAAGAPSRGAGKGIVVHRLARFAMPIKLQVRGPGVAPQVKLRKARTAIDAAGANILVNLENTGHTLVRTTRVDLRIKHGKRTLFSTTQGLKELVPDSVAPYAIPWPGIPREGDYRLVGEIRPLGAPAIKVDARLNVAGRNITAARRSIAGQASQPPEKVSISLVVWLALGAVTTAALVFALAFARLRRRLISATANNSERR